MLNSTSNTLIILAATVWYTGAIYLIVKSGALFLEAWKSGANQLIILMAVLIGIVIGKIKAIFLFYNIGKKNIDRINSLTNPKIWQFYRKRFFVFLSSMIVLGKYLAGVSHEENMALITLAVLELSIASALVLSSHFFWKNK